MPLASVSVTGGSEHRATAIEVASRQRTLAERYVKEILLAREGRQVDPAYTATVMASSANALLEGGAAPAVNGDDDGTTLSPRREPRCATSSRRRGAWSAT